MLGLVHYMVKFGYYGETKDIKMLLQPLLNLLDGRNDKPYPKGRGKELSLIHINYIAENMSVGDAQ